MIVPLSDEDFARVYLDGQPIFVHDMATDLELAPDGSSYFFVEPLAADTSQMVIHNLDLGLERTHFLDTLVLLPAKLASLLLGVLLSRQ